ncbi:MAG: PEP/pyruvate-binding domain-containing protein [Bacteroidota bacterium]
MSKLSQLQKIRQLKAPTAPFTSVSYIEYQAGRYDLHKLVFPVAVRSTFDQEDGEEQSFAGHFETRLEVERKAVHQAIGDVFASYPDASNQEVIVQQMIEPEYSGVLFAYQAGIWRLELVEGLGEKLVSGKTTPKQLLLPKFDRLDHRVQRLFRVWQTDLKDKALEIALIELSAWAQRLQKAFDSPHGLDIEFAIAKGRLYILQARPITTPDEAEEVLTSANHKEILPPYPSRLMTDIISRSGGDLFQYYKDLDPSLPDRRFLKMAAGMPWINLSALLDIMVHWGLPTQLVCASVGAEDFYRVSLRPHRVVQKIGVFFKVLVQQWTVRKRIKRWLEQTQESHHQARQGRAALWEDHPAVAFEQWTTAFRKLYVELVTNMQILTGAMSGPVSLLNRLGILSKVSDAAKQKSATTDYLNAFQQLSQGRLSIAAFVEQFGHRGFYESDIGQQRFSEYTTAEWQRLLPSFGEENAPDILPAQNQRTTWWAGLFRGAISLIHTRELLRAETMRWFADFRYEIIESTQASQGTAFSPFTYPIDDLELLLQGETTLEQLGQKKYPEQSGWDMDTFVANALGRRLPLPSSNGPKAKVGIGLYPGQVKGQVWRVSAADFTAFDQPPFANAILVAEALDPGWIPFFTKVDGVISYVGGLLSHASIILRESQIPSITQLPRHIELRTGDWIELNGLTGEVVKLEGGRDSGE